MHNFKKIAIGMAVAVILAGCAPPFADRITYDTAIRNSPGTITLSDPKLYTREALISERAKDIKWINRLIVESEDTTKVIFQPELVREVEQITAIAAAIGLNFDPAAALTYRREKETSGIQHEIDVLQLQLQLDQLKRDAEIVRTNLVSQTTPVNEDISKLSGDTSTQSITTVTFSAADQLKEAIGKLNTTLTSRLDAAGKAPATTAVTSSPFDDFRDRSAYRDMLKAAQNSAGLDQLHDYANARLIRLNFQATAIPDTNNLQSLGAIKVSVVPPSVENKATQQYLHHWLEYINTNEEYRTDTKLNTQNPTIQGLLQSGSFEKIDVLGIEVILPVLIDGNGRSQWPSNIYNRSNWKIDHNTEQRKYQDALSKLSSIDTQETATILNNICTNKSTPESDLIERRIQESVDREFSNQYIQLANIVANYLNRPPVLTGELTDNLTNALSFRAQAIELMSELSQCKSYSERLTESLNWRALSEVSIPGGNNIRVYEIGPREHVQQVSSIARSANSLALAASIAASNPDSGLGAEAAASYSRQTMGRATALERIPSVVGYSQAGENSFGWVLGPRAVLNAKGHIDIAQLLKPYDLSVDMSVPGWWSTLGLQITTSWAPSPTNVASGELEGDKNEITVPLVRNSIDEFDSLTQYILGQDTRVIIDNVKGGPLNACDKSTLLITGKNIWRARQVFLLGQVFDEDAITITADMKGILLSVPPIAPLANGMSKSNSLRVITPLGMSQPIDVTYEREPNGDGCQQKKGGIAETSKDAVSISTVKPLEFVVPSPVRITVGGANLDKIVEVQLDGQSTTNLKPSDDKQSLAVQFDESNTKSVRESDNTPLEFFEKDKKTGKPATNATKTKYVRTIRGK